MGPSRRFAVAAALVGVAAIILSACSSGSSSPSTSAASASAVKSGGTMTMALDENLAGFNINTSAANEFVLQEILDTVWPQPYIINAALKPVLNTDLLTSVTISSNPQTITYNINPKAVWQDGTPINADDFIYNWQAQSGNTMYTDVGGQPYDTASSAGYSQIASVTGSNPPGGAACDRGLGGRQQRRALPQRHDGDRQVLDALCRLAGALHQPGPGPHRPHGRLEHRVLRSDPDHLGQLVRDPELQQQPVGCPGPQPEVLGDARQAGQDRLPVLLGRHPGGARPAEQRGPGHQPGHGEHVDRPERGPGAQHHQGDRARARIRAPRLQRGRPVPGQTPGAPGHRLRDQPATDHLPHRRGGLPPDRPAGRPDVRRLASRSTWTTAPRTPRSTPGRRSRC